MSKNNLPIFVLGILLGIVVGFLLGYVNFKSKLSQVSTVESQIKQEMEKVDKGIYQVLPGVSADTWKGPWEYGRCRLGRFRWVEARTPTDCERMGGDSFCGWNMAEGRVVCRVQMY